MNILQAMSDKKLFRPWFKDPATWEAWRAFLACLFNLPMDDEQRTIARSCTGLETLPEQAFTEALACGREAWREKFDSRNDSDLFGVVQRLVCEPGAW